MAAAALLTASPAAANAPACVAYGDPATLLSGVVYAIEAFDEADADTTARSRHIDFYALVMDQRICVQAAGEDAARPELRNVTVVRLDMPPEMAKMVLQRRVAVQGPLSPNDSPDTDPPVMMKVGGLQSAK